MIRALLAFTVLATLVVPTYGAMRCEVSEATWDPVGPSRGLETVFFDDVESGVNGWTTVDNTALVENMFHVSDHMAYDAHHWWCGTLDYDDDGGYGNSWDYSLLVPPTDVTGATMPVLTYVYYHDSEVGYDYTFVEAKQGGVYTDLWDQVSREAYTGNSGGWVDLGDYGWNLTDLDNPVEARFRFISDGAWSDQDGLYQSVGGAFMVDNIKIFDFYGGAVYFFDDVETGGLCIPHIPPAAGDYWHIIDRACPAYSDPHSWWCGDDADTSLIPPNLDNSLISPAIDVSELQVATLYLRAHFEIPFATPYDWIEFSVSTDGGTTWYTEAGYYHDAESCDGWLPVWGVTGVDLTDYLPADQLQISFTMHTSDNGCGPALAGGAGIMLDDFRLEGRGPGPMTITVGDGTGYDYSTIQDAVDVALPGDTILVSDGVYTESIFINVANISLVAGSTPVIDLGKTGTADEYTGSCIYVNDPANGVFISGFTLRHADNGVDVRAADVTIENCLIYENYGSGLALDHGLGIIAYAADGLTIDGNEIYGNSEPGIALLHNCNDAVVRNNVVYDNGLLGAQSNRSMGIYSDRAYGAEITGNVIIGHLDDGIHQSSTSASSGSCLYESNVVHDNGASIRFTGEPLGSSTVRWNSLFDNPLGLINETTGSIVMDSRYNWWGDESGPDLAKRGSGDPVVGNVNVDPWIGKAGGENVVCVPDQLILSGGTPTGPVSVEYMGGAAAPIKGYSIKVSWDGTVATTAPTSVSEGDFSTGVASFFNARQSGTDEITIDCAILDGAGLTAGGTLFEIEFAGQTVDYDTCTMTLLDLDFRDVNNDPVAGIYDADGEIIVDLVGPSISGVSIVNNTLGHTDDYVKDTDALTVTATVTDADPAFSASDIAADLSGLGGGGTATPSYDGSTATWTIASAACSPADGTVTVTVSSTDPYGNAGTPGADDITADNTPPDAITGLTASPAHEEVVLAWDDPTSLDTNLRGVMVRYDAWGDYPFYATADPGYPTSETGGDGTAYNALGVSSGATHAIVPRDIHNYTAFVYDQVLLYGPADASAQDRATNYWLGDVADDFGSWGYDGLVTVDDIDKLGGTYAVSGPGLPDAECNVGPTDDFSRVGIPLPNAGTGPVVNFEDLMIFSMNYGVVAPRIVPLLSGMSVGELALSIEEIGRTENGVELALRLSGNSGEVKGTSAVLEFDGAEFVSARLSDEMSSPAADVFFWGGEVEGRTLVDLAILGTDVTIGGSGELARITLTPTAGEYSVSFAEATLRNATNEDLTAELEGIEIIDEIPTVFRLVQNVPNPFNPITTIAYHVPYESDVSIRVYDVTGRVVRTLVDGAIEPGRHAAVWDGRSEQGENCGSGVYFCVMESAEYRGSRKMMLLK